MVVGVVISLCCAYLLGLWTQMVIDEGANFLVVVPMLIGLTAAVCIIGLAIRGFLAT